MESRNCSLPAPAVFRNLMHYSHLVSFPVYLITLIILFRDTSTVFKTYKYFIIVHILINIICESYVSFLMLPMTYLPIPMFRATGWLAQWGFSGLIQFYMLAQSSALTVGSILEMFLYRLQVTIVLQTESWFPKFAKYQVYFYRFLIFLHPFIGTVTFKSSVIIQAEISMKTWLENPSLPPEITCYSVIMPVLDNAVFHMMMAIYISQITMSILGSAGPLIFIMKFIKKGLALSKETMKLQRILIISLFIQGGVHGIFIIIPTFFQVYALFFHLKADEFAQVLLLSFAYHGFLSTVAMIIFTKPLRDKFFFWSRWSNRIEETPQDSINRFSTTAPT